ncbi:hypothetical protein NDU88_009386 [Pleurodeles waltl]|uniref:Uncharacterized protein n=1 Tax=Pleurodeles waltl TaxID=8319 RepID=A0AAV7RXH0_PLEWA|nr:hypothetical protein NDU88_009386 [Pleurodeles waltl]
MSFAPGPLFLLGPTEGALNPGRSCARALIDFMLGAPCHTGLAAHSFRSTRSPGASHSGRPNFFKGATHAPQRAAKAPGGSPDGQSPGPGGQQLPTPWRFSGASRARHPFPRGPGGSRSWPPPLPDPLQPRRPGRRVISGAATFYCWAGSGPEWVSGLLQTSLFEAIRAPAKYWVDQGQPAMYNEAGC